MVPRRAGRTAAGAVRMGPPAGGPGSLVAGSVRAVPPRQEGGDPGVREPDHQLHAGADVELPRRRLRGRVPGAGRTVPSGAPARRVPRIRSLVRAIRPGDRGILTTLEPAGPA